MQVGEYLNTTYRPDRELLDGRLSERNAGEYDHSNLQGALVAWLRARQREWNIRVLPAQRIQVAAGRFRVPDVCVVSRQQKLEPVFSQPPLICIEILSKQDTLQSLQERIDDYVAFGVPNVWIFDPRRKKAYWADKTGVHEVVSDSIEARNPPIRIDLPQLWRG